jgi:hypothetical protein
MINGNLPLHFILLGPGIAKIEILALSAMLNCTEQREFLLCSVHVPFHSSLISSIQGESC